MANSVHDLELIRNSIRTIENWPEQGVIFCDITSLLQQPIVFHKVIDLFISRYIDMKIDVVVGLDARGFIFAPLIAYKLNKAFVPVRKQGKLPYNTLAQSYTLEYGNANTVEIHIDAIKNGDRVLIIDDLIATGGTMLAACKLVTKLGGHVVECAAVTDLLYLGGSKLIKDNKFNVYSLLEYKS